MGCLDNIVWASNIQTRFLKQIGLRSNLASITPGIFRHTIFRRIWSGQELFELFALIKVSVLVPEYSSNSKYQRLYQRIPQIQSISVWHQNIPPVRSISVCTRIFPQFEVSVYVPEYPPVRSISVCTRILRMAARLLLHGYGSCSNTASVSNWWFFFTKCFD